MIDPVKKIRQSKLSVVIFTALVVTVLFSLSLLATTHNYLSGLEKIPSTIRTKNKNSTSTISIGSVARLPLGEYINSTNSDNNNTLSEEQDEQEYESFDQYWPDMKQALCPNMIPKSRISRKIFDLARAELNFADDATADTIDPLFYDFFAFSPGGLGFVNREHSTIYLKIWKGGNDFIRKNLKFRLEEEYHQKVYESWVPTSLYKNVKVIGRISRSQLRGKTLTTSTTTNKACIITALRDPISHFISGYNEIEFRHQNFPDQKRLPKNEENPLLFTRFEPGSTQRFKQFVTDLLGGPKHYGFYRDSTELQHVYSMTGILHSMHKMNRVYGSNLTLTAYLPSLSNLESAFPELLAETCPGVPPGFSKEFTVSQSHESQFSDHGFTEAGKEIWAQGGDTAKALCALHVLDYACFDAIPVPDLCKQVYSEEYFRIELLAAASIPGL